MKKYYLLLSILLISPFFASAESGGALDIFCTHMKCPNSVTSISSGPNPFVDGEAYLTSEVEFSIFNDGEEVYNSGTIEVEDNRWFHKVETGLANGNYELILYVDDEENDRENFTITTAAPEIPENLELSVKPENIKEGDELIIRFNNLANDYYTIEATCEDGTKVNGKSRPDLCVEEERISSIGKDVLRVDNFFPYTDEDASFTVIVTAYNDGKIISKESRKVRIENTLVSSDEPRDGWDKDEWERWGDLRFTNPREGQNRVEKLESGQRYTIKWENIIDSDLNVILMKHEDQVSKDYLENGPTNVLTGKPISVVGTKVKGQENVTVTIPFQLSPGYYYFRFDGKAAGDSSPAIEIVDKETKVEKSEEDSETETDEGTIDANLRFQIAWIQAKIEALQTRLKNAPANSASHNASNTKRSCLVFDQNLYPGSRGSSVSQLQQYLQSTGDFTYPELTEYYGPATERAVKKWQARNGVVSQGNIETTGYGMVGPKTRIELKRITCFN